ncbi:trypsin domain-containing protein [Ditylenchus destructor]|nr:trypsin domain-containing protein [Ditylenchus destructor]
MTLLKTLSISFLFLLYNFYVFDSKVVGPRNKLYRLSDQELNEIRQQCYWQKSATQIFSAENRVLNGAVALPREFPFAAVILKSLGPSRTGVCTGSFITHRHVITARHCFTSSRTWLTLKAGGICWGESSDGCNEVDMIELEVEFAIFQSMIFNEIHPLKGLDPESMADIAVIQLKESVPIKWLQSKRIDFVCLPPSFNVPEQDLYGVIGWGATEVGETKNPSQVLRKAALAPGNCPSDIYNTNYNMCFYTHNKTTSKIKYSILGGDSGGPAVIDLKDSDKFMQLGLNYAGGNHLVMGQASVALKTTYFLNDFCLYLGFCPTDSVTGLKSHLQMEALFTPRERIGDAEHFFPFQRQSEAQRQEILAKCNALGSDGISKQFSTVGEMCQGVQTPWTAVIVDDKNNCLCGATYVTYKHLITLSDCIRTKVKGMQRNINGRGYISGVINAFGQLRKVEFIAWARSHPVAIIQLKEDDSSITPICFKRTMVSQELNSIFRTPNGIAKRNIIDTLPKLCNQWIRFCLTDIYDCDPEMRQFNIWGSAVVDVSTYTIGGLRNKNPKVEAYGTILYIKMQQILNGLCVYLNRCDDETYVFQNRLSYFISFYYL